MAQLGPAVQLLNDGIMDTLESEGASVLEEAVTPDTFVPLAGVILLPPATD